jgi:CRISPR system Cascade subunit CasE
MYLSRLILNPRSRQVQREIANPYEMHRTILRAFPASLSPGERVLFRLEVHPRSGVPTLLVQSVEEPDWSRLSAYSPDYLLPEKNLPLEVDNPAVKELRLKLHPGQRLAFRLRANPTVKKDRPDKKQGRRVGLYREEDQLKWLQRKLDQAGARLLEARTGDEEKVRGRQRRAEMKHELTFAAVQFEGLLQVLDPERLMRALEAGIGSAKGLGFGLLSLAPAR